MFRLSNCVFSTLNMLILMFGLASIAASLYFVLHGDSSSVSHCHKVLQYPLLITGCFLCLISVLGLLGSCCKIKFFLWIYSFVTFLLFLGLLVFTFFAFIVTHRGAGKAFSGKGYGDYKLGDYSNWLRNHFVNGENWDEITSCLIDAHVCHRNLGNNEPVADFYKKKLSLVQSGCCKPPTYCGFEYKNATFWVVPKTGPAVPDTDCTTWSNNQNKLCYDCNSCKSGVLDNIRQDWKILAIINICILVFIITIYSVSCCTRKSIRSHPKYYHAYRP